MRKTAHRVLALLLALQAAPLHAQAMDPPTASPASDAPTQATPLRLPDSPSPHQTFVLPPNREAAVLPKPYVGLTGDREYSLTELIDIAERANPETRIAWERARNAAIGEGMAASTYLPVITANVLGAYQGANGQNSSLGVTIRNSGNFFGNVDSVSLVWLLFDFGGRRNTVDAAKKLTDVSTIAFTGAHQQVIYTVSIAYYAYIAAAQRYETSVRALANAREVEAAAGARYNNGEGTVVESAQAHNLTAQSQLATINTQGAQQQAYAALLAAMGVSPLTSIRIAPVVHHPLSSENVAPVEEIVREALARRPDVLAAYSAVQASHASVRAAEAQNRPKVFLAGTGAYVSGQLGLTAVPPIGEQLPTLDIAGNQWNGTVLLGVSIPIFDAHRRANSIRQAKNDEDRVAATLDQVRLNAMREIVSAQITLRTSLAANEAAATLTSAAQTSYDAALDSYRHGIGTITVALEAETHLFQAQLAEGDAYTSALAAAATIAFQTGALGAAPQ